MKHIKQTQKMRIIINGVAIYTTAKQIRWGMFGFIDQNIASQRALMALENTRSGKGAAEQCATGLAGTWAGQQVQLDIL